MWSLEREVPLKACTNMLCRRERRCHMLAAGGHCVMTHYESKNEMCDELVARINELRKEGDTSSNLTGEARASEVYRHLQARAREPGGCLSSRE